MKVLSAIGILTLLSLSDSSDGYRILTIFPVPSRSHFTMCENLMKGLAARGHQVDVISHFPQKKPVPNYTDINLDRVGLLSVNNVSAEDIDELRQLVASPRKLVQLGGTDMCSFLDLENVKRIVEQPPNDPPYDLVITEVLMFHCSIAFGRHLNVPVIGITPMQFFPWLEESVGNRQNPAVVPSVFQAWIHPMGFWERLLNTITHVTLKNLVNYYMSEQDEIIRKYFGPNMPTAQELPRDLALLLVNSHFGLNGPVPTPPSVVEVGGIHIATPDEKLLSPDVKAWLDDSKDGCIFFSFGSMVRIETFPNQTLKTFYETFSNISPVRVLLRIVDPKLLPPGLPKNVMTKTWFPQTTVLAHRNIRAFVTHGGLMSTWESISFGVPMIGIPLFGDQQLNIQRYVNKEVAVSLSMETITTETFTNAVRTILNDPTYTNKVKALSQILNDRPMSPLDTAIYWVEYVGRHGNVLRSPTLDLTWWQNSLLDVYGFLLLCVLVVLYILKFIIRKLCSLLKFNGTSRQKKNQ